MRKIQQSQLTSLKRRTKTSFLNSAAHLRKIMKICSSIAVQECHLPTVISNSIIILNILDHLIEFKDQSLQKQSVVTSLRIQELSTVINILAEEFKCHTNVTTIHLQSNPESKSRTIAAIDPAHKITMTKEIADMNSIIDNNVMSTNHQPKMMRSWTWNRMMIRH